MAKEDYSATTRKYVVCHAPTSDGGPDVLMLILPIGAYMTDPAGTPHPAIPLEPAEARLLAYELLASAQRVEMGIAMPEELKLPDGPGDDSEGAEK